MAQSLTPRLKLEWLKDLKTDKEREEFKQYVLSSQKVLDKLREIVYNMSINEEKVKTIDYDSPSWSHKQAHLNGKQEVYRTLLDLLTFKEH